jgi:hypothetical protein
LNIDLRRWKKEKQRHWAANAARVCVAGLVLLNAACTYHTASGWSPSPSSFD